MAMLIAQEYVNVGRAILMLIIGINMVIGIKLNT